MLVNESDNNRLLANKNKVMRKNSRLALAKTKGKSALFVVYLSCKINKLALATIKTVLGRSEPGGASKKLLIVRASVPTGGLSPRTSQGTSNISVRTRNTHHSNFQVPIKCATPHRKIATCWNRTCCNENLLFIVVN
jgi:hypothetical protein